MNDLIERLQQCGVTAESRQAAKDTINELERLTSERDMLVVALKGLADWFDRDDRAPADRWLKNAQAALAKVGADKTGEQHGN